MIFLGCLYGVVVSKVFFVFIFNTLLFICQDVIGGFHGVAKWFLENEFV